MRLRQRCVHSRNDSLQKSNEQRSLMKITGRTILITGGSAGIGLAFAIKFLELGNQVIVTGRRQEVLDAVKSRHPQLQTIRGDVADPAEVAALAARVKQEFPRLDVLMNNAGIGAALEAGKLEIRPGQSNQFALLRRLAPNFINRRLWQASKAMVPAVAV